jgi:signal transduction histidine kinase
LKNRTLLYFIAGSLFLLSLLEFLWLQKSYNEQRTDLQQLVQQSLRAVVGQEANALILRAVRNNPTLDSLFKNGDLKQPFKPQFLPKEKPLYLDSSSKMQFINELRKYKNFNEKLDSLEQNESNVREIRMATKRIEPLRGGGRNDIQIILGNDTAAFAPPILNDSILKKTNSFYLNWSEDSINLERISSALTAIFSKNKLPKLPFKLSRIKRSDVVPTERTAIVATARIFDAPQSFSQNKIGIAIYDFEPFLLKKIMAETFFALFVFGITAISFWLVYNNFLKQKELTAIKNAFISNITHELKTPIATVSVALEALQSFDALENRALTKEYLDISRSELQRLSMLVDKVLKLAIFDEKEPELRLEAVNLPHLVRHVADSLRLQFEKNGAIFNLNYNVNSDLTIEADPTHLTSVIYNLLDNALKYGGKKINCSIELALIKSEKNNALNNTLNNANNVLNKHLDNENNALNNALNLELNNKENELKSDLNGQFTEGPPQINLDIYSGINLQINDDGKGIPKAFQDKIFDKFFRVPTDDVHDTKGHGLGLSYVSAVVQLHGGSISVESEENIGTNFNVFLPKIDH